MRERDRLTAERFGMLDRVESLEKELLKVDHVVGVEFDLDGFYSDIYQVIVLPEYDIPVTTSDYFAARKAMLQGVLAVTREYGLLNSGDQIEDYGKHYYIVRDCDGSWKELVRAKAQASVDGLIAGATAAAKEVNQGKDSVEQDYLKE